MSKPKRTSLAVATEVKSWAWPQLYEKIMTLLAEEPEFVGEHARFARPQTPLKFLGRYGISQEDEEIYKLQNIDVENQPIRAIQQVLATTPSWGEFIGGLIGAVGNWTKHERDQVLPFLHTAINYALQNGVDH